MWCVLKHKSCEMCQEGAFGGKQVTHVAVQNKCANENEDYGHQEHERGDDANWLQHLRKTACNMSW